MFFFINLGFDGGKTELPQPFWEIGQDLERYDVSAIDADFFVPVNDLCHDL